MGEAELLHSALPSGCDVLELGCGAGRITHGLLALGHRVVAVDQSAEMLSHVRGAETVLGDIETLDLVQTFPAVVLASNLVNAAEPERREGFLSTCRRHLAPGGTVLVERLDPDWLSPEWAMSKVGAISEKGPVRFSLRQARVEGSVLHATMDYEIGSTHLAHSFRHAVLDDDQFKAALASAGLGLHAWLDPSRRWAEVREQS